MKEECFLLTSVISSSTVNELEVRTVPRVVRHLIAGFLLLAKARPDLAFSATRATCSGLRAALDVGPQCRKFVAPFDRPSSSFSTVITIIICKFELLSCVRLSQ